MKQRIPASVFIVSAFLIIYVLLLSTNAPVLITRIMFIISPFLVIWMVISVLRSKTFTGKDLEEGEEWGYADKEKEKLGMF
jgi:hypothetical protein